MNFINAKAKAALWRRDLDHCYDRDRISYDIMQHVVIEVEDPIAQQIRWCIYNPIKNKVDIYIYRHIHMKGSA